MSTPSDQAAQLERLWRAAPESRDALAAALRHNLRNGQPEKAAALLRESWSCPAQGRSPLPELFNNHCKRCSEPVLPWSAERPLSATRLRVRHEDALIEHCLKTLTDQSPSELPRCVRRALAIGGHELELWWESRSEKAWLVLSFSPSLPPLRQPSEVEIAELRGEFERANGAMIDISRLQSAEHLMAAFQEWESLLERRGGRLLWILPQGALQALRRLFGSTRGWFTSIEEAREFLHGR